LIINKFESSLSTTRLNFGLSINNMAEILHRSVEDLKRRGVVKQPILSQGHVFTEAEKLQIEYEARKAVIGQG
jgi:hypothetical protein